MSFPGEKVQLFEEETVIEQYEEIPSNLFLEPTFNSRLDEINCPELGYISEKVCKDACRIKRNGKCPLGKKE